jgi:hypothetical protein
MLISLAVCVLFREKCILVASRRQHYPCATNPHLASYRESRLKQPRLTSRIVNAHATTTLP